MEVIKTYSHPKAKMGWYHLHKLVDHIGSLDLDIEVLYLFGSQELVLLDPELEKILKQLNIPFELVQPCNSIKLIKDLP